MSQVQNFDGLSSLFRPINCPRWSMSSEKNLHFFVFTITLASLIMKRAMYGCGTYFSSVFGNMIMSSKHTRANCHLIGDRASSTSL